MPQFVDIVLVVSLVATAISYLAWRKVRSLRSIQRDWSSGHADVCDHCPAIKIRQAQMKKLAR